MRGDDMHTWTPADFIEYIDEQYFDAKRKRIGRLSIDWGVWSREMNLVLRKKTEVPKHHDDIPTRFKYVFAYWVLRSQLLELYHKHRFTKRRKIKTMESNCKDIKKIIFDSKPPRKLRSIKEIANETIGVSNV